MIKYTYEQIDEVIDALNDHKIIAFPTDTVYGVGVAYGDLCDLTKLKHCKNRPETKPIPVMVNDVEMMKQVAIVDDRTKKIAQAFLPGAMTLVLPINDHVDTAYTNGLSTIAIRIPDAPFLLDVIKGLERPLLVTSANQSGQKTACTSEDVFEQLPDIDGIVLGQCQAMQASTIVDLTNDEIKILRQGPITLEQLLKL